MKYAFLFMSTLLVLTSQQAKSTTLSDYMYQAYFNNVLNSQCSANPSVTNAHRRIDWALNQGHINLDVAQWAKKNQYYPIIEAFDQSLKYVCSFEPTSSSRMSLDNFKGQARYNEEFTDCVRDRNQEDGYRRIDFALEQKKITNNAGLWGRYNEYYPVIEYFTKDVIAVCRFWR